MQGSSGTLLGRILYLTLAIEAAWASASVAARGFPLFNGTFTLPIDDHNTSDRAAAIEQTRKTFLYGPSIAGNNSFYPTGELGNATASGDWDDFIKYEKFEITSSMQDENDAVGNVEKDGGLSSLDDFRKLYQGQWGRQAPSGPYLGMLTNYTDDLLFSMERLSINPMSLQRAKPDSDYLFEMDDAIARNLSTMCICELLDSGRLFYVDYSFLGELPLQDGKYAGASQAYFFIHPTSGDFLPLAIKPGISGSDLIYTPLDEPTDWLFAKMLFNGNDAWFGQFYHLAATHEVVDIVYAAAVRTFSEEHPLLAVLGRIAFQTYAFRPAAMNLLAYNGGPVDNLFPWSGSSALAYADYQYGVAGAGAFQGNYLETNLQARGLINAHYGPELKSFPFYEDASFVVGEIKTFLSAFVAAYYASDDVVVADVELQNWIREAGPAAILDFPAECTTRDAVVDVVAHMAYLAGVLHNTLNADAALAGLGALPLHPLAMYAALPTQRGLGAADLVRLLPNLTQAASQIQTLAAFNRPLLRDSNLTLAHVFDWPALTPQVPSPARDAAATFLQRMLDFGDGVRARSFDADGLSMGMPFVWTALDPRSVPFWLAI